MQKIFPCLWVDDDSGDVVDYYLNIFKDSKLLSRSEYGETGPGNKGTFMTAQISLLGYDLQILNGGPAFKFNEAISLVVSCQDQGEVDYYWDALVRGGEPSQCGWLKDKYGLSWQIVPVALAECLGGPDRAGAKRALEAMLKMSKLDVKGLQAAYNGG